MLDPAQGVEHAIGSQVGVQQRQRGTPPSAALGLCSQESAALSSSNTAVARATTRARRTNLADSSGESTPSRLRRARVRSGIASAWASSLWVMRVRRTTASTHAAGKPWRTTAIQSRKPWGRVGSRASPPSKALADVSDAGAVAGAMRTSWKAIWQSF